MFGFRWTAVATVAIVVVLIGLLAWLNERARRRRIRRSLGLPENSPLSQRDAQAFRAFEDTDARLRKTFPKMSDTQRRVIARDVLRDKGLLPRKK